MKTSNSYLPLIGGTLIGDLLLSAGTNTVRTLGCTDLSSNGVHAFNIVIGNYIEYRA